MHAVLEDLFDLPAAERTIEAAKELLLPTWERMLVDNPDAAFALDPDAAFPPDPQAPREALSPAVVMEWISTAEPLLATYFDLEDPTRLEPQARELRVEIQLDDGPPLRGIIDRVDVAPGDLVRVVDYKSGRSPGVGFEQKALFQMRFYALMLWRINGNIPTRLQLIYLGDSQVLKYDPTEAELIAFEKTLRALWSTITRVAAEGNWAPKPSKLCNWCDHHDRCPAKGGTPPDLPIHITTRPTE